MHKLEKKIILKGYIKAETGLLIGGSSSALQIGGTDKQVVRNPVTQLPYIPGSSLKGKMRSLLELAQGTLGDNYGPTANPQHIAAQLFGYTTNQHKQPSRIIVRDAELRNPDKLKNTELLYTEVKAENTIDRVTAAANPRFFERVPKGAEFSMEIIINVFDNDKNKNIFLSTVFDCLKLVQDDYLGGGGSRGNGMVKFVIQSIVERTADYYTTDKQVPEKSLNDQIPQHFF